MKTLVVGAGGGGIASALLAALRDETVTLVESHSELGGCASYFKRGSFMFDVGATTMSGLAPHEPLGRLFKLLGHSPDLIPADPGMVIHLSSGKRISYYRDFEKWMTELQQHFPSLNHRPFWKKIQKLNVEGWKLMRDVSSPLEALKHPQYVKLLPYLAFSVDLALKRWSLDNAEYREMIDGILIISAQTKAAQTPFLVGAMALAYPAETYAPRGGMKGLMDFFERELLQKNVEIKKKTAVKKVVGKTAEFQNGTYFQADRMIFNMTIWNLAEFFQTKSLKKEATKNPGSWGAFTIYLGCKSEVKEMYHQIHLNHPLVPNYFVSFSELRDANRAPENYQTVSISIHVDAKSWFHLTPDEYKNLKSEISYIILDDFKHRFPVQDFKFVTIGTPKTFEDYTGRRFGFVGGIPFTYGKNPLKLLSPVTEFKEVYRTGDTIFPGQGLCGVVAGALQLHERLRKNLNF